MTRSSRRKRCRKGKSCGATCISNKKYCQVDMGIVRRGLSQVRDSMQPAKVSGPPTFAPASQSMGAKNPGQEQGIDMVRDTLSLFNNPGDKPIEDIDGVISPSKVNWNAGIGKGARYDAAGAFGAFIDVPPDSLARGLKDRFPNGVGVKYGEVTRQEIDMLRLAGETGGSPRLISARLSPGDRVGMVAMERVPGTTLRKSLNDGKISREELADVYLSGIAKLHRAGISHGDAHLGNAILQPNGEVKFIDLGFAKASPTVALNEAIRAVETDSAPFFGFGGAFEGRNAERLRSNFDQIVSSSRWSDYMRMTSADASRAALEILKDLYEGI